MLERASSLQARRLPGDGVALVVHEVMAAFAGVGIYLIHQAAHAGVDIDMGGEDADIDVETSTRGLVDQVNAYVGKGGHHFINYRGETIPW